MGKIGKITTIVAGVIILYLLLLVMMPVLSDATITANQTMDASNNMSLYPGTSGGILSAPWVLWFAPGVIGIALIVITLRSPS